MAPPNRETSRDALATLLEDELVTNLGIVAAVYNRKVDDPQGQSPIVCVLSAGTARIPLTFQGSKAEHLFEVQTWVLYADPDATPAWTEADAEDRLDLIEKEIAEIVDDYGANQTNWIAMDYEGRSVIADIVTLGGVSYVVEKIPIVCVVA